MLTSDFIHPEGNPSFTMGVASTAAGNGGAGGSDPGRLRMRLVDVGRARLDADMGAGGCLSSVVSNLVDRVFLNGTVRDFLAVPRVLVFNLGEAAVDVGLVAFVGIAILHMRRADS